MTTKNQPNQRIVCSTCGLALTTSILKCPRCNTVLVKLEGCSGSCFSCMITNDKCDTKPS